MGSKNELSTPVETPSPFARQESDETSPTVRQEQYECPLYRISKHESALLSSGQSTNHICTVHLPTAAEPNRWILAGISLVCEPDE